MADADLSTFSGLSMNAQFTFKYPSECPTDSEQSVPIKKTQERTAETAQVLATTLQPDAGNVTATASETPALDRQRSFSNRESIEASRNKEAGNKRRRQKSPSPDIPTQSHSSSALAQSPSLLISNSIQPTETSSSWTSTKSSPILGLSSASRKPKPSESTVDKVSTLASLAVGRISKGIKKAAAKVAHPMFNHFKPITREELLERDRLERIAKDERRAEILQRQQVEDEKEKEKVCERARIRKAKSRANKRQLREADGDDGASQQAGGRRAKVSLIG